MVTDIRYGNLRQGYGNTDVASRAYVDLRFLDTATAATTGTTVVSMPVNTWPTTLIGTVSFGRHSLELQGQQSGSRYMLADG